MREIKRVSMDATSVTYQLWDKSLRRWYEAQIALSHRYQKLLAELARKGTLPMGFAALRDMLTLRPSEAKMVSIELLEGKTMNNDTRRFLDDVGSGLDDDGLSIKSLARRGYDSDGDVVMYKSIKLWPAAVFDQPQDDDSPDLVQTRETIKIIAQPSYQDAFEHYLRLAFRLMNGESAMAMLSQREKKSLNAGVDSAGGYFVPADVSAEVLARVSATAVVRGRATVVPTIRDRYTQPAFAPHGSSASVYSSGFTGTWSPEAALWTDADPSFEIFEVGIKKLRVGAKISRDLANDAGGVEWLISNGADNLGVGEDLAFLTGSGVGVNVEGILIHPSLATTDVEGTTVNTITNTTAADGSASKLLTLAGALPSQYQRRAVLVAASATEASVNKLIDAQRGWLFPRVVGSDGARVLMGYSVANSPHMPLEGTDANAVMLIGDMAGYLIAARSLITLRLDERFADVDQLAVILTDRVGGAVHNIDAFRTGVV